MEVSVDETWHQLTPSASDFERSGKRRVGGRHLSNAAILDYHVPRIANLGGVAIEYPGIGKNDDDALCPPFLQDLRIKAHRRRGRAPCALTTE